MKSDNNYKTRELSRLRWSFTSQKKKAKLLQDTLRLLCLLPETKELLEVAAKHHIPIRFNDDFIGTYDSGVTVTDRARGQTHIELKPYAAPEDILPALIHELRHVWQNDRLGVTAKTMALGEQDADTALLLMRVKEADAYTYTDIAIKRLNNAMEAFTQSEQLREDLQAHNGGKPLSVEQEDLISDVIACHIKMRIDDDRKDAVAMFMKALTWLDDYDRETLSTYHRRYTDPSFEPLPHLTAKDGSVIALSDIRKLTEFGQGPTLISYMNHLDDVEFENVVLRDVAPELLESAELMTTFEKAATPQKRQQIDLKLKSALRQKPAP